jgi:hypothetical protein
MLHDDPMASSHWIHMLKFQPLVFQNVAIHGNEVFKDIIKLWGSESLIQVSLQEEEVLAEWLNWYQHPYLATVKPWIQKKKKKAHK